MPGDIHHTTIMYMQVLQYIILHTVTMFVVYQVLRNISTILHTVGTCFPVPYNGDASTLNISVQKDGVNTEVTIPFRG